MQCNCLKYNYLIFRTPLKITQRYINKLKYQIKVLLFCAFIAFCVCYFANFVLFCTYR
jgi:amino acid permease